MKVSELILHLGDAYKEHGDLEVGIVDQEYGEYCEICAIDKKRTARGAEDSSLGAKFIAIS